MSLTIAGSRLSHTTAVAHMFLGVVLLSTLAQLHISIKPIPVTLQTFGVLLIGLLYERRLAVGTLLAYLGAGFLGLPVFSGFFGGPFILFKPQAGYLIGFVVSVWGMGFTRQFFAKSTPLSLALHGLLGICLIYLCGITWLACLIGFPQAIYFGLLPFILPELLKTVLLAGTLAYFNPNNKLTLFP